MFAEMNDNHDGCDWYFGVPFKSKRKEAEMAGRKFKVGDRVRCNGGYSFDPTGGTITEVSNGYCEVLVDDAGTWLDKSWSYQNDDLELLPHYARGTRIQLLRDYGVYKSGHRGTVTYENDENVGALMDIGRYAAFPHEVVAVADDSAPGCAERKVERKFKVGDRVTTSGVNDAGVGTVLKSNDDGSYQVKFATWYGECREFENRLTLVTPAPCPQDNEQPEPWLLGEWDRPQPCIVALINKDGKPRPSQWPHVHPDSASATAEAERLARNNPGTEFAVYQRVAGRVASVEMKGVA